MLYFYNYTAKIKQIFVKNKLLTECYTTIYIYIKIVIPKKLILTENQLKRVLSFVVKEQTDENDLAGPVSKEIVVNMLKSMDRDLERANSGNFAHMAANLRGGIIYLIELVEEDLINKPNENIQ